MTTKIIAVQLEACHANPDGSAWYAYCDGPLEDLTPLIGEDGIAAEIEDLVGKSGVPLGIDCEDWDEVPSELSKHANLRRYYVGAAV
jgi:hypothetical protein